jgi:drug/metabolite transporter (DMT)-like permease
MSEQTGQKHTAGALDIRNIIGGLLGAYGVILVLMGLFGDKELDKTGDWNANLWAGLALVVVAAVFLTWARLRPIVVPDHVDPPADPGRPAGD